MAETQQRFLRNYPLDVKCMLCGKTAGNHNAYNGGCPVGRRDRIGSYSHSNKEFFTPRMPKLPKHIKLEITKLQNAVIKATRADEALQRKTSDKIDRQLEGRKILQELEHAQYQFQRALAEELGTEQRRTTIRI